MSREEFRTQVENLKLATVTLQQSQPCAECPDQSQHTAQRIIRHSADVLLE
jgi:hypothetical protein